MDADVANPLAAFGFLTVLEDEEHGFFGGYLILTDRGRPLEFHCSTPVLPSQAQRILYGATLRSYVLGELIGQTLVGKAQLPVHAVFTDLEEMLSLGLVCSETVACVATTDNQIAAGPVEAIPSFGLAPPTDSEELAPAELLLGSYRLYGTSTCDWQPDVLSTVIAPLIAHVDLLEPFERIREAIREAQRVTEPPAGNHDEPSAAA